MALVVANMPLFKEVAFEAVETIFAIKAVAKRLALVLVLEAGIVSTKKYVSLDIFLCHRDIETKILMSPCLDHPFF